jgi:predicted DNA-binding transcriptional regulator AlpA
MPQEKPLIRIIRPRDVSIKTGMSLVTVGRRQDPKSPQYDPEFPKSFPLSESKRPGAPVGFLEHEVDAYVLKLVERGRARAEAA